MQLSALEKKRMEDPLVAAWAMESIDFSSLLQQQQQQQHDDDDSTLFDFVKKPLPSMVNDCSAADTLSTAGESSSSYDSCTFCDNHKHNNHNHCSSAGNQQQQEQPTNNSSADTSSISNCRIGEYLQYDKDEADDHDDALLTYFEEEEDQHEQSESKQQQQHPELHRDDLESSLTLDDLRTFFLEDQVGIFDPFREDLPPPKPRTDFKGDSQNSFTLEDLEDDVFENLPLDGSHDNNDNKAASSSSSNNMASLLSPTARRKSKRRSTLVQDKPLKGILKNGSHNTRRSSSLTMLMMEDSSMLQLSLGGGNGNDDDDGSDTCFGFDLDGIEKNNNDNDGSLDFGACFQNDDDDEDSNENFFKSSSRRRKSNGWSMMQQSFAEDCALDLLALEEKRVEFSSVVIHYHGLIVGDNPSVSEGAPLSLDWKAEQTKTFTSVEAYEIEKRKQQQQQQLLKPQEQQQQVQPCNNYNNSCNYNSNNDSNNNSSKENNFDLDHPFQQNKPRRLEAEERMWLLLNAGVSLVEIQKAELVVGRTREDREATKQQHLLLGGVDNMPFMRAIRLREEQEAATTSASTSTN